MAVFCSNCEHLKLYGRAGSIESNPWVLLAEIDPNREEFDHLKYPPFTLDLTKLDLRKLRLEWGDLRVDGYLGGKAVISKTLSGRGVDARFELVADDHVLVADGADTTRVVARVTDEFGAVRTYANDPIAFTIEGPATLIGENPFALIGGTCAVWVRAGEVPGAVRLNARHPRLGSKSVEFQLTAAPHDEI